MARPRNQAKRREQLVDAAHAVAARKGLSEVQLRDVAQAAGLTSGAVKYYFDDLDALFHAAYERAIERFCAERERVVAAIDDPAEALAAALRLGVPTGPGDVEIRLLYEYEAVAFRSPGCAEMMAGYVERQVEMYTGILARGVERGTFAIAGDLRAAARNLVALEDGHGVYVLTGHMEPADVERLLLEHAATITGQPSLRAV